MEDSVTESHGIRHDRARPRETVAVHERPELAQSYVAPRDEMERVIAQIWQEVLGLERVGVHDNFFTDLSGHSLLATQLVSRLRSLFQIIVPLASLFEGPTIAQLAVTVAALRQSHRHLREQPLAPARRQERRATISAEGKLEMPDELRAELIKQRVESTEDSVSKSHATRPEPATQLQAQTGDPLFVLASPRSFSSVAAGMLGQHPQMYGVPELQLLGVETMAEWWQLCAKATFPMTHGLLRAVAELYFGEQTDETILRARTWLRWRSHFTTGRIIKALSRRVQPLILVEKSPSICYRKDSLQRALRVFPRARFIHLVRHPWGHSRSVLKAVHDTEQDGPVPYWIMRLAAFPERPEQKELSASVHPQRSWQVLNRNIVSFLEQMPATQWIRVRGEDLLAKPEEELSRLAHWLGIRADSAAIEEMKHPERSAFACLGPSNARLGNDIYFLTRPTLRADRADVRGLDEPFTWRDQKFYFCDDVKRLARSFGYS